MNLKNIVIFAAFAICTTAALAATTAKSQADQAMAAWGGQQAFKSLGIMKFVVTESDSLPDGTQQSTTFTLYYDTETTQRRLELPEGDVVIVSDHASGWATSGGQLDDRAQTSHLAPRFINNKLLPVILPFSMTLQGVGFPTQKQPQATHFQGAPANRLDFSVPTNFFNTPLVNTRWAVFTGKDEHNYLGAEFLPVPGYEATKSQGMRFHVTKTTEIDGVRFCSEIAIDSIDSAGKPTGNRRTMKIRASVVREPSPALFLHPDTVRAIEEGS